MIKDCSERNKQREPGYESVTKAMQRRLKALVGAYYWKQADEYLRHFIEQKRRERAAATMITTGDISGSGGASDAVRPVAAATTAATTTTTTTATKRKKGPTATSKLDATRNSGKEKKRRIMLAPMKEAAAETTKAENKPVMATVTAALAAAVTNISSNHSSSVLQGNLSYNTKPRQHKNHQKSKKRSSFSSSKSSSAYDKSNTNLKVALTGNKYAISRNDKTINTKQTSSVLPKPSSASSLCPSNIKPRQHKNNQKSKKRSLFSSSYDKRNTTLKVAITGNKYASSRNGKNINTKQTSYVLPKLSSASDLCPSIATSNTQTASSILDKAWQLTSRVIALATKDIKAIATDDIFFLATRLFKAQEEFKTNKVPFRVDIAYHHTECKNLQTIRADGLLSKKERQKNGIASKYNGSKYGDGIYLSNDPIAYKKFGNTVIMVARLKGSTRAYEDGARFIASNDRDQNPKNNNKRSSNNCSGDGIINTIEVKNGRFCVVEQAKQCLPLYQIPSSNIRRPGFPNEAAKIALWTLADFQLKVQDVIDEILNNDEVACKFSTVSCE